MVGGWARMCIVLHTFSFPVVHLVIDVVSWLYKLNLVIIFAVLLTRSNGLNKFIVYGVTLCVLVWVLAVFSHWNGWCHQASCLLSNILFYSPFVWSKWEKKICCWSVYAGHVFKGQELGPPGLSRRLLYFKGQTCHLQRTFCQWLVGIRSRFRCDNWWRQRCCKWQNVGLHSSQVLLSTTVLNFGEG